MKEFFFNIIEMFTILDFIFLFFLIINSLISFNSGFTLSLISFLKWVFAIILTVILLPILSPHTKDLINSEFAHDMVFGSVIFILSIFLIILFSKGIKKTLNWTGFGGVDKFFGLIFGLIKGYIYFISIFTLFSFIHPYEKWNKNLNEGKFFEIIISGKQFFEENLPKRYEYIDESKEKVNKITK
jgi:membrane protein required for colicin V production